MNDTDYSKFPKGKWAVSKKFHDYVIDRFSTVAAVVVKSCDFYRSLLALYHCYLDNHHIPDDFTDDLMAMAVFETIRPEIDKAIVRSFTARRSAVERHRRKAASTHSPATAEPEESIGDSIEYVGDYPTGYIFYLDAAGYVDEDSLPPPLFTITPPVLTRC